MNPSASGYAATCRRVDGWTATLNSSTKSRTSRRDWSAGRTLGDRSLNKVLNAHGCLLGMCQALMTIRVRPRPLTTARPRFVIASNLHQFALSVCCRHCGLRGTKTPAYALNYFGLSCSASRIYLNVPIGFALGCGLYHASAASAIARTLLYDWFLGRGLRRRVADEVERSGLSDGGLGQRRSFSSAHPLPDGINQNDDGGRHDQNRQRSIDITLGGGCRIRSLWPEDIANGLIAGDERGGGYKRQGHNRYPTVTRPTEIDDHSRRYTQCDGREQLVRDAEHGP